MKHEHRHKIFKPVYANDNEEETKPSLEKKKKGHTECLSIVDINDSTKVT